MKGTKESSEKVQERQRERGITRGMESKIRIENGQGEGEGGNRNERKRGMRRIIGNVCNKVEKGVSVY